MIQQLKTINVKEFVLNQVQNNVLEFANQLVSPVLSSILIEDVEISNTGPTAINHGLGRAVTGWFVVKINQNSNIYAADADQELISVLELSSSYVGTTKISILIF